MNDLPSQHVLTRFVFLRALALVAAVMIWSLWPQLPGLVGTDGILPYPLFLERVANQTDGTLQWLKLAPTLGWFSETNALFDVLCGAGLACAALLFVGIAEGPMIFGLFVVVLSLCGIGQQWLGFQWEALLCEVLFATLFIANWHPWPRHPVEPSPIGIGYLWLVLWKLIFLSGLVKLLGGDTSWTDLTAMTYHYETQPLSNPMSWYAHHAPLWWHQFEAVTMLVIELVVVWAVFGGVRLRLIAFFCINLLMAVLFLTGNYGYFQLLTTTLTFTLLPDRIWLAVLPQRLIRLAAGHAPAGSVRSKQMTEEWLLDFAEHRTAFEIRSLRSPWQPRLLPAPVIALLLVNTLVVYNQLARFQVVPSLVTLTYNPMLQSSMRGLLETQEFARGLRVANSYGLFQTMTKRQPEIRFEGSADGKTWMEYPFLYKPDDPMKSPPVALSHMPRLDWQLWFAALRAGQGTSGCQRSPWVQRVGEKLLDGSDDVVSLFASNPFPDAPPARVRITVRDYTFTDPGDESGAWWVAGPERLFCPVLRK